MALLPQAWTRLVQGGKLPPAESPVAAIFTGGKDVTWCKSPVLKRRVSGEATMPSRYAWYQAGVYREESPGALVKDVSLPSVLQQAPENVQRH